MKTRTLKNKRWLPLAIVPLFSVAVLSGCSSDDDDDDDDTGSTVVADANGDGTPDAFQVLDPFNADATLVDENEDSIDDRDLDMDGIDDRDANENGIADQYESPADSTVAAADENGNSIDDSFEVAEIGGADDADGDGVNDAAAALLAGGTTTGTTTGGETAGETTGTTTSGETGGETGGETAGETTGGTTGGETTGGDTGTTTGGTQPTGTIDGITFGSSSATADLTFDGSRITGSVNAPDTASAALYSGIAASAGVVQQVISLNGGPTFFMPNPLTDQENAPILENFLSGNLYVQLESNTGEIIRSDQLLPPGGTVTPVFSALEVAADSGFNSNGAGFIHVNTLNGQYSAVVTVNIDVSDLDENGNTISVAAAHIHSGSAAGDVILELAMDTSTSFSATGTLTDAQLATIQQNEGWFNVHLNDGTTPGASLVTGQIVFTQ